MDINQHTDFVFSKPNNRFLESITYSFFYINIPVNELQLTPEYIIPFPRVTFGYFFNHPFKVINLTTNEVKSENSLISKVTKDRIVVEPTTNTIQILGAHLKPYALAYFINTSIKELAWSVTPYHLLNIKAKKFEERLHNVSKLSELFDLVEESFLDALLLKDIQIVIDAVTLLETNQQLFTVAELSSEIHVTERTLRNHFYKFIGCSPKDYIQIVRIKRAAYNMYNSQRTLTHTGYDANFYDQAHFANNFKNEIGKSPNDIRYDMPKFRFLQF